VKGDNPSLLPPPNLFTPLAGQNLEAVFREADGSSHELELSAPLSVEAVQTPQVTSSNQEQNPTENDDNIDPMETFLNSITTPLEQPLLPNPEPILYPDQGEADEEIVTDQNQRKNTCLANKAKSRVGKNVTELAQELLAKKLGELTHRKHHLQYLTPITLKTSHSIWLNLSTRWRWRQYWIWQSTGLS